MKKIVPLLIFLFIVTPALADITGGNDGQTLGATYTETTVAVTAGVWTSVLISATNRKRVILGDNAGLGCSYSFNSSPATNEGFPFSLAGTANTYVFEQPAPLNQIYVKCSSTGTVTVGVS